jgi:hypothetical protein
MKIFLDQKRSIDSYDQFGHQNVSIDTIAGNLSRICRFNGACGQFYSVAEHSVLVSHLVDANKAQRLPRAALLHDAGEAYYGDIIRPVQERLEGLRELRQLIDQAIESQFGIRDTLRNYGADIDSADNLMLTVECNVFFGAPLPNAKAFREVYADLASRIKFLTPVEAQKEYMLRFNDVQ